ncbi:MAG: hypothetical protein H6830_11840 [Planctomycetes bacterium]|nr:hypothetical protein [Planctomycetota bacterium]MCB9908868.1 hypothetical protein [Planctomycetota bacterium]HPF14131.1 hypothetical protein [Planctomycetota bacterium]
MWILSLSLSLCLQAAQSPPADLAINIDFGDGELAPETMGAEALEPGLWNPIRFSAQEEWPLFDTHGRSTGVRLAVEGAASWVQCPEPRAWPELVQDGVHSIGEDQTWMLRDLPAGSYALLVYARPHCQAQSTSIELANGEPDRACMEPDTSGFGRESRLLWVRHWGGTQGVTLHVASHRSETRLVGMQWIRLSPDPDRHATDLLWAGEVACALGPERDEGRGFWMRAFAGGATPVALWRWAGREVEGTPFPGRPAIGTYGLVRYDQGPPDSDKGGVPDLEWAGSPRWAQLWGRDGAGAWQRSRVRWFELP